MLIPGKYIFFIIFNQMSFEKKASPINSQTHDFSSLVLVNQQLIISFYNLYFL